MNDYRHEKQECELALKAVIDTTPQITRAAIDATQISKPLSLRRQRLADSIALTRKLLDELTLRQVRLGWHDRRGDAA